MPQLKIEDLNRIYNEAEAADKAIFAEYRSNILLIAGEHYSSRRNDRVRGRTYDGKGQDYENQKLRLTKNHTHKVQRQYVENIMSYAPGIAISPNNEEELQDIKAAELNQAVWQFIKKKYRFSEKKRGYCHSYVGIGEVAVKIFWDPNAGDFKGYEAEVDEMGNQVMDEMGQPIPDQSKPVFSGGFVFEEVYGFNLLRQVKSGNMRDAHCYIIRKMTDTKELKSKYKDEPDKVKFITESDREDFIVFDQDRSQYTKTKNQTLVREFYFKPCYEYPRGYYYISTAEGILEEGELPYGIFPIIWQGMDIHPTAARARSILKVVKPFQAEINRASSAAAQTQISIGDDKILYQDGSTLSQGALLPGVRGIAYNGNPPTILPGRDGGQYAPYVESQIAELNDVIMLEEENQAKMQTTSDNYALLFRAFKQQKKFAEYGEKFQQFEYDICELVLELARKYLPDDEFIQMVGRNEAVNIEEFRNTSPLQYKISLEEQDETVESKFGRQLIFNHILQYVGPNLDKKVIGKMIKNMPFVNLKDSFNELTIDEDNVRNDMLMIERKQDPFFNINSNHEYYIQRFTHRMKQSDFRLLDPEVQNMYQTRLKMHEQAMAYQAEKIKQAQTDFIPVNGAMIATDMYVPNPSGPDKPAKRVRIPYQALDWLVKQLESQGASLDKMETMNKGALADMADMLLNKSQGLLPQQGSSEGQSSFNQAPNNALGVS